MATMHQTVDLATHDPHELFEALRAAATAEETASKHGLGVTKEFIGQDRNTLELVISGDARALMDAHREISSHGPHGPHLAVATSREELALLRELGSSVEIDFENPARAAFLTHSYTGPENPRDMATGYAKSADLIDEARRRDLAVDYEHDDHSLHVTVRGPKDQLDKLAAYADERLSRAVDVEDDD